MLELPKLPGSHSSRLERAKPRVYCIIRYNFHAIETLVTWTRNPKLWWRVLTPRVPHCPDDARWLIWISLIWGVDSKPSSLLQALESRHRTVNEECMATNCIAEITRRALTIPICDCDTCDQILDAWIRRVHNIYRWKSCLPHRTYLVLLPGES